MNRFSCLLCSTLVVFGCGALATRAHAADATAANDDRAAIEALEKQFAAAFNAKDLDAIMKVYAPGASLFVFDVTPPRQYVGWAAYKKDFSELLAAFPGPAKFDLSDLSITVVGPVAYSHSIQSTRLTAKDGSKLDLVVRVTDVYRKMHGKWLIVQEHVSVPVDLATAKADLSSKP